MLRIFVTTFNSNNYPIEKVIPIIVSKVLSRIKIREMVNRKKPQQSDFCNSIKVLFKKSFYGYGLGTWFGEWHLGGRMDEFSKDYIKLNLMQ